jgi:predicted secreted protein
MASAGKLSGNVFGLYINVDGAMRLIAASTGSGFTLTRQVIDVTSKDNAGARAVLMAGESVDFTFNGILSFDQTDVTTHGYDKMLDAAHAATLCIARWSTNVVGDKYLQCSVYISSISGDAPVNAAGTYTVNFTSTGAITVGTET